MAELAAARKSCLEEARKSNRTRQEYNINVILVIKLIIVANIQWQAGDKSYDCLSLRRQEMAVLVKVSPIKLVFFNIKVFVVNLQHH
ncbi:MULTISPECIES: hypothetical protein [unclassified Janthinobacterium]|uniref:hypothetical protein n=1 Tax=unclassified Janthinobacterium TaxID=2610881 RepID=UPI001E598303|nr:MULTISPECIES: hypothetical protein [unclassified Janthinobacterium]MCC7644210.1 hypothetical protein [Janthinobacterium sp. EB271-G4-3-1]MCC7693262.1 hypothetical protein [Janthinobacterium sp. EB271-G4-3-2]